MLHPLISILNPTLLLIQTGWWLPGLWWPRCHKEYVFTEQWLHLSWERVNFLTPTIHNPEGWLLDWWMNGSCFSDKARYWNGTKAIYLNGSSYCDKIYTRKIYHLGHFSLYNSVLLSTFTELYSRHRHSYTGVLSSGKPKCHLQQTLPSRCPSPAPGNSHPMFHLLDRTTYYLS